MYKIFYIGMMTLLLSACADEMEQLDAEAVEDTTVTIGTRSALYPDNPDNKITGLRVMAFKTTDQQVRRNIYYTESQLTPQITFPITAGTYNFVVIANEPRDGVVNTALDAVANITDINSIQIANASINDTGVIPMINTINSVKVLPGNAGVMIGGLVQKVWNITLKRLAARFDLTLYSNSGTLSDLNGITFSNIPDYVPLMNGYTGTHTASRSYTVVDNPELFTPATVAGAAWAVSVGRIILPSNDFTPIDQSERAIKLAINLASGAPSPSSTICINEQNKNYTLPRNTNMRITGQVKYPVDINITSSDWGLVNLDGDIYSQRFLNLSTFTGIVNERNTIRIYFSSDQSNVTIEPSGYIGPTGSNSFDVNSVFESLAGSTASNLHYTSGTSEGYIDICAAQLLSDNNNLYRIYLNANNIRREITLLLSVNVPLTWNVAPYLGTFHRANQVGERVICSFNSGPWNATVEYPTGTTPFVNLTTTRSIDPMLGMDSFGNAEQYTVSETNQTIAGNNRIYFRVGMKSKLASASTKPRYARIKLNNSAGTKYIYVRQGEAPDYLMRPTDEITTGAPSISRPNAKRISPFNLTDPQKKTGRVDRGYRGYVFTDYPSQSGYFFLWGGTYAWYPGVTATDWVHVAHSMPWDNYASTWETSPAGYRRISDGVSNSFVTVAMVNQPSIITASEIRQSLWANPVYGNGVSNVDNFRTGYYADGFSDRGQLRPLPVSGEKNMMIGTGANVAYFGWILFNDKPDSFASIFYPGGGVLQNTTGNIMSDKAVVYLTNSVADEPSTMNATLFNRFTNEGYILANSLEWGGYIRPISDE